VPVKNYAEFQFAILGNKNRRAEKHIIAYLTELKKEIVLVLHVAVILFF
jgi:hypothetical protein